MTLILNSRNQHQTEAIIDASPQVTLHATRSQAPRLLREVVQLAPQLAYLRAHASATSASNIHWEHGRGVGSQHCACFTVTPAAPSSSGPGDPGLPANGHQHNPRIFRAGMSSFRTSHSTIHRAATRVAHSGGASRDYPRATMPRGGNGELGKHATPNRCRWWSARCGWLT